MSSIVIAGDTSGSVTLQAPAVSGSSVLTLPAVTDTVAGIAATQTLTNKTLTGAVVNGTVGATTPSTGAFTTLSATGVTTLQAGTAALPALTTTGDTNTGIFFPAADTIAFSEGGTESMRLNSSGDFIVGNTGSPFSTTVTTGIQLSAIGQILCSASSATAIIRVTATGTLVQFRYQATVTGDITTNGTTTAYNTSSDYRLKENIQPMTSALVKVAALKPCTYKWKADNSNGEGFIAHELAEVVPECVTGEKDAVDKDGNIKPQGIDTSFLVATLTAAIQEQQALITALTQRITALEGN